MRIRAASSGPGQKGHRVSASYPLRSQRAERDRGKADGQRRNLDPCDQPGPAPFNAHSAIAPIFSVLTKVLADFSRISA